MRLANQCPTNTMSSFPSCSMPWRDRSFWSLVDCLTWKLEILGQPCFFAAIVLTQYLKEWYSISIAELCNQDSMRLTDHCQTKTMSSLPGCSMPWRYRSNTSLAECPCCKLKKFCKPCFLQPWFWHKTRMNKTKFHLQYWVMHQRFNEIGQSMSNQNHVITFKLFNALRR